VNGPTSLGKLSFGLLAYLFSFPSKGCNKIQLMQFSPVSWVYGAPDNVVTLLYIYVITLDTPIRLTYHCQFLPTPP